MSDLDIDLQAPRPDPATRRETLPPPASAGPDTSAEGSSPVPSADRVELVAAALPANFTIANCPTTRERHELVRVVLEAAAAVDAAGLGGAR